MNAAASVSQNQPLKASTTRISDFTIIKKLGDGAYSSVFKVRRKDDNEIYALKNVKMLSLSEKEKENALNEVRILASIDHPNVIAYRDAFIDESTSSLCLVMEYACLLYTSDAADE